MSVAQYISNQRPDMTPVRHAMRLVGEQGHHLLGAAFFEHHYYGNHILPTTKQIDRKKPKIPSRFWKNLVLTRQRLSTHWKIDSWGAVRIRLKHFDQFAMFIELCPIDFHLFLSIGNILQNLSCFDYDNLKQWLTNFFTSNPTEFYKDSIHSMLNKWRKIDDSNFDNIAQWSAFLLK